jgi:uncharacterized membrane protein
MTKRKFIVLTACIALLTTSATMAAKPVQFEPLGVTCGPAFFPTFCVVDMSGDGQTILFRDQIWRPDGSVETIGGPPGGFSTQALSDDGSTVVGNVGLSDEPLGNRQEAAIWQGGSNWQALGGLPNTSPCGFSYTSAFDVSGDGSEVVGLAWIGMSCANSANGFSYTAGTGMVDLGRIVPTRASRVNAISADGSRKVGWSDTSFGSRLAAIWDGGPGSAYWIEPDGSSIFLGEAQNVNSDGSIVVGGGYTSGSNVFEPWIWSSGSSPTPLGVVKTIRNGDTGQHIARDVSDDGSVVVGQDTLFQLGEQWAWIWNEGDGIEFLQNYVRDRVNGPTRSQICDAELNRELDTCSGWDFWNIAAISNDGKVIVGTGRNPNGFWEAFRITLP